MRCSSWRPAVVSFAPGSVPDVAIEPLPSDRRAVRHIGDSLATWRVLAGLGQVDVLALVNDHWVQLIGQRLSRVVRPSTVRHERLVLSTDVPAAAEQVRWLERDLLDSIDRLSGMTGTIVGIDVRVSAPPAPSTSPDR